MAKPTLLSRLEVVHAAPPFLRCVVTRYARAFAAEQIVLFGSYAKGTKHAGSDVDLLVIANIQGGNDVQRRARQLAADCLLPVDIVFATPEDISSAATAKSPFLLSILESGIVVYRRS
jgi:predicted nucleotidyltransferase